MKEYIFYRKDGFYILPLESPIPNKSDDEFAYDNALCNPGTTKVETVEGKVIYPIQETC